MFAPLMIHSKRVPPSEQEWLFPILAPLAGGEAGVKSSTPLPRKKSGRKAWAVSVAQNGLLEGSIGPAASTETLSLLHRVVEESHEMTEEEMTFLFSSRGADFDAVCAAAGEQNFSFGLNLIFGCAGGQMSDACCRAQ